jgi:hypothetical protein
MFCKRCLSKYGKTLILIMKPKDVLHLDPKYCKQEILPLTSYVLKFNNSQTFLQIILVNHFEDTNKLGDKMDTIGLQDFVKN